MISRMLSISLICFLSVVGSARGDYGRKVQEDIQSNGAKPESSVTFFDLGVGAALLEVLLRDQAGFQQVMFQCRARNGWVISVDHSITNDDPRIEDVSDLKGEKATFIAGDITVISEGNSLVYSNKSHIKLGHVTTDYASNVREMLAYLAMKPTHINAKVRGAEIVFDLSKVPKFEFKRLLDHCSLKN